MPENIVRSPSITEVARQVTGQDCEEDSLTQCFPVRFSRFDFTTLFFTK